MPISGCFPFTDRKCFYALFHPVGAGLLHLLCDGPYTSSVKPAARWPSSPWTVLISWRGATAKLCLRSCRRASGRPMEAPIFCSCGKGCWGQVVALRGPVKRRYDVPVFGRQQRHSICLPCRSLALILPRKFPLDKRRDIR